MGSDQRGDPAGGPRGGPGSGGGRSGPARYRDVARGLVRACHPEPTLAVTALSAALAAGAGHSPAGVALVTSAVLTGQLSIGWSNDLLDAARDRASGRSDKPVASGALPERVVRAATALALVATVVLSLATGLRAGGVHLVVVASGWAYNAGLKRTAASWVPYAVAFGALPAFVVLAAGAVPPWWLVLAGALLGVGAHMFNVLPDIDDDLATGVRSLPVRLGPGATRLAGCLLLVAVAVLLGVATAPGGGLRAVLTWTGVGLAVALAGAAAVVDHGRRSRRPFLLALAGAAVDVALLVGSAGSLPGAPG